MVFHLVRLTYLKERNDPAIFDVLRVQPVVLGELAAGLVPEVHVQPVVMLLLVGSFQELLYPFLASAAVEEHHHKDDGALKLITG